MYKAKLKIIHIFLKMLSDLAHQIMLGKVQAGVYSGKKKEKKGPTVSTQRKGLEKSKRGKGLRD